MYEDFQDFTSEMLFEYGQRATHTSRVSGTYDPTTSTATETTSTQTVLLALFKVTESKVYKFGAYEVANQSLINELKYGLIAAKYNNAVIVPLDVNDTITDVNGNVWTIKKLDLINPAGVTVAYRTLLTK